MRREKRWIWLLAISYLFYSFIDIRFSFVLMVLTTFSFVIARKIGAVSDQKEKMGWTYTGVFLVATILLFFKYFNLFSETLHAALAAAGLQAQFRGSDLFFPVGVSFYSLQIISYLMDVFNGKVQAESHFGFYALYVAFFPKLLIGPIERFDHLRPQLEESKPFNYQEFIDSLLRIGWGLFKKMVIADRLAFLVNTVFTSPGDFYSPQLIYTVIAFSLQIYIDFSAYCDIAIGIAKVFGVDLMENFNFPYFATSVVEFWRRWHISLSTWLRDYIFLPLSLRHRRKKPLNLWISLDVLFTFIISGLWHGETWTFLIWGALHGFYQAFEITTKKYFDALADKFSIDRSTFAHRSLQIGATFVLVSLAWVFFRADSVNDALLILKSIFTFDGITAQKAWLFADGTLGLDRQDMGLLGKALLIFLLVEFSSRKHNLISTLKRQPLWFRWLVYLLLVFSILIFGFYGDATTKEFVYFNF